MSYIPTIYEVKTLQRGTLATDGNGNVNRPPTTRVYEQDFSYDSTGNWTDYLTKVNGSTTLNQSRTHTVVNEIEKIDLVSTYVAYD